MNTSAPLSTPNHASPFAEETPRPATVSVGEQQAFEAATARLRAALLVAADSQGFEEVADARLKLRALAVKLRDAGFWRSDKHGLRSTVSLLWEADRFVNEQALLRPEGDPARN